MGSLRVLTRLYPPLADLCWSMLVQAAVLRQIYLQEGSAALWRGLRARVLFHAPAAAICWGTYETAKRLLL